MLRRSVVLVLALASLAAPLSARADNLADEAEFRFRRGAELYAKRDYQGALDQFFTSNRLVHNHNVAFNIARTLEQLNRVEEAYRWYAGMLEENIPAGDRKDVLESIQRLSAKVALVRVESDPPGATIYVDRKDLGALGTTPRTLALPPKPAKIILELAGHYSQEKGVSLATGKQLHVSLALPTIYGKVKVALSPPEATAHLEKEDGELLHDGAQVVPGRHVIWVGAPGSVPQTLDVNVPAEGTAEIKAALVPRPPPTGALVVRANVDGALIIVDGKESGFTPGVVEGVTVGKHSVAIDAEGRERFTRDVDVTANERSFVDAHLRYAGPSVEAATKSLARASDAPGSITVITREELRAFGYQTVAEALRSVRGIFVSDDRSYTTLGFRGISPLGDFNNRVLILVDGHAVYDPWVDQGYVARDLDVDLDDVERIEVVRGGGSALYGTGAVFGVINVVHRAPDEGAHMDLEGGLGNLAEEHGRATASIGSGRFGASATAAMYDSAGDAIYRAPEPSNGQTLALDSDAERAFHAGLRLHAGDFQLLADFNNRRKDSPTGQYDVPFGYGQRSIDGVGFVEARYEHGFDTGMHVTARGYYDGSRFHGSYPTPGDTPDSVFTTHDLGGADSVGAELLVQLQELARNHLSLGLQAEHHFNVITSSETDGTFSIHDNRSESIGSAYVNDELRLMPALSIVAGVRLDDHVDSFGLVLAPRAAMIGHFYEGATTKLMVSRSFRAPSIYERYYTDRISQVPALNLQPEFGLSAELEHTHPITDEASITGAFFYSQLSNLIDLETRSDGFLQYMNSPGTIHTWGGELEVRYRPGPLLMLNAVYSYQHTRDDDGQPLDNSPEHTGAVRAMVPVVTDLLTVGTELVYNSARYGPPNDAGERVPVGEGLNWNLVLSGYYPRYRIRYQASVLNALDEHVEQPATAMPPGVNVAQYGRQVRLSAGVTF